MSVYISFAIRTFMSIHVGIVPQMNQAPGQCDPHGIRPCCSPLGWCGNTTQHCTSQHCTECQDYRERDQGMLYKITNN